MYISWRGNFYTFRLFKKKKGYLRSVEDNITVYTIQLFSNLILLFLFTLKIFNIYNMLSIILLTALSIFLAKRLAFKGNIGFEKESKNMNTTNYYLYSLILQISFICIMI